MSAINVGCTRRFRSCRCGGRAAVCAATAPCHPIRLYDIGAPLSYEQLDLMYALHQIESDGVLNLIGGNKLQVRKPMAR